MDIGSISSYLSVDVKKPNSLNNYSFWYNTKIPKSFINELFKVVLNFFPSIFYPDLSLK